LPGLYLMISTSLSGGGSTLTISAASSWKFEVRDLSLLLFYSLLEVPDGPWPLLTNLLPLRLPGPVTFFEEARFKLVSTSGGLDCSIF
jgi:hypothetical protein